LSRTNQIFVFPKEGFSSRELNTKFLQSTYFAYQIADTARLQHKFNRLRLLATCSITITNKQNHNVIDYDYIESNQDCNRDYICLETSSERKQTPFAWFDVSIFSDNIRY